jgi:quercetin dioxygenase-like cupin family protein
LATSEATGVREKGRGMRRLSLLAIVLVALFGVLALSRSADTAAQEATPAEDEGEFREGIVFEPLAMGSTARDDLTLLRLTIAAGVDFQVDPADPETALIYVESGTLTVRIEAPVSVTRAGAYDAEFASPEAAAGEEEFMPPSEEIPAGQEFQVATGDSFLFPAQTAGDIRNDGTESTVILVALTSPHGAGQATPES